MTVCMFAICFRILPTHATPSDAISAAHSFLFNLKNYVGKNRIRFAQKGHGFVKTFKYDENRLSTF